MKHCRLPYLILIGVILGLWAVAETSAQQEQTIAATQTTQSDGNKKSKQCVITGFLVNEDGSAAANVAVYVYPYKEEQLQWYGLKFYEDDTVGPAGNPRAKTDSKGRFRIQFASDFLDKADTEEFAIGTFASKTPGGPMILTAAEPIKANIILNLGLFNAAPELDINKFFKAKKIIIRK